MFILLRFVIFALMIFIRVPFIEAQSKYPVTSSTLQTLYHNETQDHLTYLAYAQKAISENYPGIAYLLVTLAASESIHARNYKQILSDLGVKYPAAELRGI
jgi:rubrerythrin